MVDCNEPIRTCIGCRTRREKGSMFRFVLDGRRNLVLDKAKELPGRGAYVCADIECLKKAIARKAFSRSLRSPVKISDPDGIVDEMGHILRSRGSVTSYLSERG